MLAVLVFCVYQYGLPSSLEQVSDAYHRAQSRAKEYIARPEAGWRQGAQKLNDLLPKEGVPTRFDLTGRVVRVADGDTISVLDANKQQHSIRFYGIDTPEYDQPHGSAASVALKELLADETVGILVKDVDRLGRTVGIVYWNETNINLEMVKNGHAWWYRHYASANRELKAAEQFAKLNKLGLWSGANPVPPWDWRRGKRP
ncbi:MAG: endonuclease YncB(thermonuclease family) [Halioglobus sp.]|jgi:endonuclease YncB( thermonuclease family)